jgi:hypothetical protein
VSVCFHTYPIAQVVEPTNVGLADLDDAVREARELVRAEGKDSLVWWVEPAYERLGPELEQRGLLHETPGFEAVENAMALVDPPSGNMPDGVTVGLVETMDDLAASDHVTVEAFGMGPEASEEMDGDRAKRYAEYATAGTQPGSSSHLSMARSSEPRPRASGTTVSTCSRPACFLKRAAAACTEP